MTDAVAAYLDALDTGARAAMVRLRDLVHAAHPCVVEHIKWNAPSFVVDGEDRITFGMQRDGTVRVVIHRGAKPRDTAGFSFADPAGFAKWPTPDRGTLIFADEASVVSKQAELGDLFKRWLALPC